MSTSVPVRIRDSYTVRNRDRGCALATNVAIASTGRERRRGLLHIEHFSEHAGLWIAPCEAVHTFGMKMRIDAVFLDREFRVRKIQSALKPSRISICLRAYSVLELSAGVTAQSGTSIGDKLEFLLNAKATG